MDEFRSWLGRTQEREDRMDPGRSNALLRALGSEVTVGNGDALIALHHWIHFWDVAPPNETGPDGHPRRGGFLPPISLPRRMWAGGRLTFREPLRYGETVRRASTIRSIERKSGRSGELIFVTVSHRLEGAGGGVVEEEQDLVYRDEGGSAAPTAEDGASIESVYADPVLLFRYSALTMNSHRIHYDQPYATGIEHYPDLVVHGPLQATLLADLAGRHLGRPLADFAFRGVSAAIAGERIYLHAVSGQAGLALSTSQSGQRRMSARAG